MTCDAEPVGGHEQLTIEIAPYDVSGLDSFARGRARITDALGRRACRIDHIGSTAVEGLPAKPIIDIDVSVADPDDANRHFPALKRAGYQLGGASPGIG